jgi:hypothetical protein
MIRNLLKNILDFPSFQSDRKLIVFLSDDWGAERIVSTGQQEELKRASIDIDGNRFNQFDSLENESDILALYKVLRKHKNTAGKNPLLTLVSNVANPNYEAIKRSKYENYFFKSNVELFSETHNRKNVPSLYREGIDENLVRPEFHGREHIEVSRWLSFLKKSDPKTIEAFDLHFTFLNASELQGDQVRAFDGAFNLSDLSELKEQKEIITSGLNLFKEFYGCDATCFTPPSTFYSDKLNPYLADLGINTLDVPRIRKNPIGQDKYNHRFHYTGQKNSLGQGLIVRNTTFEPNEVSPTVALDKCLKDIDYYFSRNKPVIISNHRAAFVGGVSEKNRDIGLESLDELLSTIFRRWPDAEFITPHQLYKLFQT